MPGFDGTGPMGRGPLTGGGFGPCGRGLRRGVGRGRGFGIGRGRGFGYRRTAQNYNVESELEVLKRENLFFF